MGDADLQPALFVGEEDAAILFPPEVLRKRYTAEHAAELERLATAICMLLPTWPVETIARQLHVNLRTVRALAAREAEKVAGCSSGCAEVLMRTGFRWVALARSREHEAGFKDLTVGAGIIMQHARDLAAMGQIEQEKSTKEVVDHAEAAAELRRLMEGLAPADDTGSIDLPSIPGENGDVGQAGAVGGAGEALPTVTQNELPEPVGPEGGGGGSESAGAERRPMDQLEWGLLPKGPPP